MPIRLRPAIFSGSLPAMSIIAALAVFAFPMQAFSAPAIDAEDNTGSGSPNGGITTPGSSPAGGAAMRYNPDQETPEILYDLDKLPEPARRMRSLIMEACRSGDIEKLRALIGSGAGATQLSFGELNGDPIDFLLQVSGDSQGHEILAILLEVLEAGFVHLDAGTEREVYVWPYFFAVPLEELTAQQRVELFKLVTAGDYEGMKTFGAYIFYRAAITPDGRWMYFVAGD